MHHEMLAIDTRVREYGQFWKVAASSWGAYIILRPAIRWAPRDGIVSTIEL